MATAKTLRRQAERCAILAEQTQDDDARARYLRLRQMYIQLADDEERPAARDVQPAA